MFPCLVRAADVGLAAAVREYPDLVGAVLDREAGRDDVFPWERLDMGVSGKFLYSEWMKYHQALLTPPCPADGCDACGMCGMNSFLSSMQE